MPKEIIHNKHLNSQEYQAQILWGRDQQHVQVATTKVTQASGAVDEGIYVDLDRTGINNMIRVLRRARDQAYGRDE
jgi:hypothetical protein